MKHIPKDLESTKTLYHYLKREEDSLIKSIEHLLHEKTVYIGSYEKEIENFKIDHLLLAKASGLSIPETLITTEKKELLHFFDTHKAIITKDIRYPINATLNDTVLHSNGTFIITNDMINALDNVFAPIFVQKKIEKLYEIRIFFFRNTLYPMAIFSQNDPLTKIDYRNYNEEKPNRCVPTILPDNMLKKLKKFIYKSSLSTGSIDMIYSKNEQYIFLEVNPMGQLDWVSKNCNYYIEKDIATYFAKIDH